MLIYYSHTTIIARKLPKVNVSKIKISCLSQKNNFFTFDFFYNKFLGNITNFLKEFLFLGGY
ncbi:MAG: hypothetical protein A2271_03350 [Candidatus Moranbacteria bacterium RIFOXYA12_FULL_35_19]|nr:MAG: hypothetical protein A2343_03070 [Candidatus Moranbacteria bacterium RIFOXYB12_FULL_35_8]OGI36348.1 MAG: hypothetical protein A2271_03350 [Candidatus Moranbacteria bacterium RIFOXYA12_FULL_35_19]